MKVILGLIAACALFISAPSANAEQVCAARDKAVMQLEKQFEERVSGRGLATNGKRMVELFVSEVGSWTVLVSEPTGRSCIVASGDSWQGIKQLFGDPA